MHLIRHVKTSFEFVLNNEPIVGMPLGLIHYLAGSCYNNNVWLGYANCFIWCRLLSLQCPFPRGVIVHQRALFYNCPDTVSSILCDSVMYPIGTHIPVKGQ